LFLGEPLSREELVRRDERRKERKILRQLEKQRRRLENRGIFKDLATLRLEWQQKRAASMAAGASGAMAISEHGLDDEDLDDDEDDEIDVENDDQVDDDVDTEAPIKVRKDNVVAKENKASAFSIDNLLSHAMQKSKEN
jgi:hypothetical protein